MDRVGISQTVEVVDSETIWVRSQQTGCVCGTTDQTV